MNNKAKFFLIILLTIFFAQILNAQENESRDSAEKAGNITAGLKEGSEKIEKKITKEIEIPESLRGPAKIIFGIEENLPLNVLVISLMLWIILFSFFFNILEFFSPLSKSVALITAIAMTSILSFIGSIKTMSVFLFNIGNKIKFLEELGILGTIIAFIIIIVIWFLFSKTIRRMKIVREREKAIEMGARIGADTEFTKAMREAAEFGSD